MIEMIQPIASMDPAALDHIDIDGLAKHVIKVLGIPATVIRSDIQVASLREQRAQQQQQQAEMQQAAMAAEAAGKAAPALEAVNDMQPAAPPLGAVA